MKPSVWFLGVFAAGVIVAPSAASASHVVLKVDFNTKPQATRTEEMRVAQALKSNGLVSGYRFISKADALAQVGKKDPSLVKTLPFNPLPDEYIVTLKKPSYAQHVARGLRSLPGVKIVLVGRIPG